MATLIANPIYDSVFKFLMADNRAAKIILSDLLQREVVEVEMKNSEYAKKIGSDISVLRIDFGAKVKDSKGVVENVNIELQKAWLTTEIIRFRKYISQQYQSDDNRFIIQDKPKQEKSLHMVNIYLLGHSIEHLDLPVTYVYPRLYDQYGQIIDKKVGNISFINELVHDMIIVQIPKISKKSVKSRLDNLLTLFDQEQRCQNAHQLSVDEKVYQGEHEVLLRRLMYAHASPEVGKEMDIEDEYLTELERRDQIEANMQEEIDNQKKEIDNQKKELASKDAELETQKEQMSTLINLLKLQNYTEERIAEVLNVSVEEIKKY